MKTTEELIKELDEFTIAYLVAALWSTSDQDAGVEFLDQKFSLSDIAPESLVAAVEDCRTFREKAAGLLEKWSPEEAGHDFWLTRCGHGAGFWDRGRGEAGDKLTELVGFKTDYPNLDPYVGDDGKIYGFGEVLQPKAELVPSLG